jgi:hypothetical protein
MLWLTAVLETGDVPPAGTAAPVAVVMQGPTDTAYQGGTFQLIINVPEQYPLVPPAVKYKTKIFHPNVHFKVGAAVHKCVCCCAVVCQTEVSERATAHLETCAQHGHSQPQVPASEA